MRSSTKRSLPVLLVVAVAMSGCLPSAPATGRQGPVRKVALIGDSLTFGLFGTTASAIEPLRQRMSASGISLSVDGGPGDTLATPWPTHAPWVDQLRARIQSFDPDVVIIQSVLFPGADDPNLQANYRQAMAQLLDVAQSRGAHVYIVRHHRPTNSVERHAADVAEQLQAEVVAGRGVPAIPLDWWLARCRRPFVADGWHLSADGARCWADAATAAINQLRNAIG